ncbi:MULTISPECIES: hypothetical protein [unclassified Leifsonia]|uniref:hypothetical protein n=1 Tax=unclassified Leifsonia TaxID=2663824 RepID=UPI000B7D1A48|nr:MULTISPECIES: hypothetical protein [unclassified Leifsonia]
MPKLPDKVGKHIHADVKVSVEKVLAFHAEPGETQLLVRSELRRRIADDPTAIQITIAGLAIAFFGLLVVPAKPIRLGEGPWLEMAATSIVLGVVSALVVFPVLFVAVRRHERKVRASVWLAAFDDVQYSDGPSITHKRMKGRWDRAISRRPSQNDTLPEK